MGVFERAPPASRIDLGEEAEFDLGGLQVIPAELAVVFDGDRRELQPRVMQVLVALAKASPAVVSRDRLVDQCWDGRIVGDDAVNRVILSLRHLANEFTPQPFRIGTIPRVGHQLIANGNERKQRIHADRRGLLVAGSAISVVAAVGLGWAWRHDELPQEVRPLVKDARAAMFEDTVDQLGNAAAKLKKAAELAPDSGEVWGLLALAYGKQLRFVPEGKRKQLIDRVHASSRRALAIERDQPDAQAALILAMPEYRNWLNHERACLSALRSHPNHADLNIALARSLAQVGRCADALKHLEVALTQQPMVARLHVFRTNMLWNLGRLDEAESEIERSFGLWPRHSSIWFARFYFLMYNGRSEAAVAMHADSLNRPIGIPDWNFDLSALQARAIEGDRSAIDRALAASESAARQGTGFAQNAIIFASAVNALDEAFELLDAYYFGRGFSVEKTYFTKRQGVYWNSRHRDTHFLFLRPMANVRRDGRFRRLTADLELEDYWKRSGTKSDIRI